jgi:hypothetical protein
MLEHGGEVSGDDVATWHDQGLVHSTAQGWFIARGVALKPVDMSSSYVVVDLERFKDRRA